MSVLSIRLQLSLHLKLSPNISINVLFDFFKTLNTGEPENEGDPPVFNQETDDLNNIINAPITIDEIKSAMKNLKNNKASGNRLFRTEVNSFPKQLTIVIGL
jgi:hypothetical protein